MSKNTFTKNALSIIELKNARNHHCSPLLMLSQAICYGLQALRCKNLLTNAFPELKEWPGTVELVLAAPRSYWGYWECLEGDGNGLSHELTNAFQKIINQVNSTKDQMPAFVLRTFVLNADHFPKSDSIV